MGRRTTQYIVLGLLVVVLAAALWFQFGRGTEPAGAAATAPGPVRGQTPAGGVQAPLAVPEVRLSALRTGADDPVDIGRNPFRLQPKPAPPPVLSPAARQAAVPETPAVPPPPPPPPPIPLVLIGLVDAPGAGGKIAVLSDKRDVFYGREGDIIDGRYRIVRIGAESVDMTYLDGRGARTIPLSVA